MQFKEKRKKEIHLDITPIVDTVFNLLIFFALSLNFTSASSLKINLPEISANEITRGLNQATIQITEKGEIYLNQRNVNQDSLHMMLKKVKSKTPQCNIIIEADVMVLHGKVVAIMDICKKAGFNKISIAAYLK